MTELVEFLRARLDEDEQVARKAYGRSWVADDVIEDRRIWILSEDMHLGRMDPRSAPHVARHDPARVLAEVEAKRRIIAECAPTPTARELVGTFAEMVLAHLALPYADHADYDPEWRPL